jgi:hypothetical protein
MKLLWYSYLVPSLGTSAMKLCTETDLISKSSFSWRYKFISRCKHGILAEIS